METVDLIIAADWEYDRDFIALVERASLREGLATCTVWPDDLPGVLRELETGRLEGRFLFDRASSTSPEFLALQKLLALRNAEILDPIRDLRWASDKATMHLEFIAGGLNTPHTVILPSVRDHPDTGLAAADLKPLGSPFVIKPANTTGGSLGVVRAARAIEDVEAARGNYPSDKYLLQEVVSPREEGGRRFWFRGFYILGLVLCAWWDERTHVYAGLLPEEVERFGLRPLFDIVRRIAAISNLRFFSTEIARDRAGRDVVIDYVNETCDMRLQSGHADGVPDSIVEAVAARIAAFVRERPAPGSRSKEEG